MAATPVVSVAHESGVASWGPSRVTYPEHAGHFLPMWGIDVQGMLHLRLPTPGLLRLAVRRMQESQGQAPDTRPQSIHVESASPRTRPRAGKGPAVRLSRRRAGRMRKTPWPMRCPQHHSRPLADRTHRARRSRPGPQRPATHARPVQALPRQQDCEDETFGLQQQTKPQLTHTGFGTKTKTFHRSQADDASRSCRTARKTKATKSFRFDSRLIAAASESNKKPLQNKRKQTVKTPTGIPPKSLGSRTAGELSPRCGGFKSFRGGGRKALRPTAKERRKAVRRWRSHAKRRKTRQVWPDARSVERSERTQGIHFAQPAEHRI